MNSYTEENYLKAIYHLSANGQDSVSTNSIAAVMNTKAASVTDMLKKLFEKKLINYARYQGVSLTGDGRLVAVNIIRKHRLWECFLVDKLHFKWDEVHDLAEELEHITSPELIARLDKFLGHPRFDPHGDPIPDTSGHINNYQLKPVASLLIEQGGIIMGVGEHTPQFLQYLEKTKLIIGNRVKVMDVVEYDQSVLIKLNDADVFSISRDVAKNILVKHG
jgi:DtxR family Mn-dependent transcriptional regulator